MPAPRKVSGRQMELLVDFAERNPNIALGIIGTVAVEGLPGVRIHVSVPPISSQSTFIQSTSTPEPADMHIEWLEEDIEDNETQSQSETSKDGEFVLHQLTTNVVPTSEPPPTTYNNSTTTTKYQIFYFIY
ncbi:unnamed protein product [Leptosia nina]|uniref:Uncharacterized protein n=1 Tax=Leptosia nina TaxID=320188 RepID=A0AAV1JW98_9NEOP